MRCSYACGSADHVISRRSFLGAATAGLGLASGFSGMVRPAVSAELARRERQVLLIWLPAARASSKRGTPSPAPTPAARSGRSRPRCPVCGSRS